MESLDQLLTALLTAHAPWWLLAIIAVGIVLRPIGPIRLNLSIGEHAGAPAQPDAAVAAGSRTDRILSGNTSVDGHRNDRVAWSDHGCK